MTTTYAMTPLDYRNLTNREFEGLMAASHQVLATFARANKSETMYTNHLLTFTPKLEQLQAHLGSVGSQRSLSLRSVDEARDRAVTGLYALYRGFAKIDLPHIKQAHEILAPVFAKHKDITKHAHDVATTEIKSLLKAFEAKPYDNAILTLGLQPIVTVIITAQADYERVEKQIRTIKATKEVGKTKQLRTELSKTYDLFMRYTAASAEAYPEKPYFTQLLKELNAIRTSKRRLTHTNQKSQSKRSLAAVK